MAKKITLGSNTGLQKKPIDTDKIKGDIIRLHGEIQNLALDVMEKACKIGQLLTQKKTELEHGQFIPWIKSNLPFDERQAQKYTRIYENKDLIQKKLDSKANSSSLLTVNNLISLTREDKKPAGIKQLLTSTESARPATSPGRAPAVADKIGNDDLASIKKIMDKMMRYIEQGQGMAYKDLQRVYDSLSTIYYRFRG